MGKNITVRVGDSLQNFQDVNITRFNEVGGGLAEFVNTEQLSAASNIHIIPYYPESTITDAQKQEIIQALTLLKEDEGEFSVFIKQSESIIPATYTISTRTVIVYGTDHNVSNPRTYRISLHTNGTLTVSDEAFYVYDIGGIDDDTKAPVGSVVAGYVEEAITAYFEENPIVTEESDPTVPAWAKEPTKPSYTAKEVGALPDTYTPPDQTAEQVGADPEGTADAKVSAHNVSNDSHNDIRLLIEGLASRLNALADSTDEDLDQLSEVVAYIKANKSLIDSITTNKVSVADIVNNLTTNVSNKPLSAAQGVALKALIDAITVPTVPTNISAFNNDAGYIKDAELESAVDDALTEAKESGEFDGATGERGTGILYITTAPSSYTTATGGFTPVYRIELSTVKTQSKADKVLVGDTVAYSYYHYPVGYVDSSYVYLGTRKSIRGATGGAGTSVTVSTTTESDESGGDNVVNFSDGKSLTVKNGKDGENGYTPVKGVDYFDGADGKSAYACAQDGGYTGTEAEFARLLSGAAEGAKIYYSAADGGIYVNSRYSEENDICFYLCKKGPNSIFDFSTIGLIEATSPVSNVISPTSYIVSSSGDWHAPYVVSAVNNGDGDNISSYYFTGGNHGYDNTANGVATARTANLKMYADGKALSAGESGYCNSIKLEWDNYVQGYNTTKADGSGREILREHITMLFDGYKWNTETTIYPLEDIIISTWYGLQFFTANYDYVAYIGGETGVISEKAADSESGNAQTNAMKFFTLEDTAVVEFDTAYDLGTRKHASTTTKGFFAKGSYSKAYGTVIGGSTALSAAGAYSLRGSYTFKHEVQQTPVFEPPIPTLLDLNRTHGTNWWSEENYINPTNVYSVVIPSEDPCGIADLTSNSITVTDNGNNRGVTFPFVLYTVAYGVDKRGTSYTLTWNCSNASNARFYIMGNIDGMKQISLSPSSQTSATISVSEDGKTLTVDGTAYTHTAEIGYIGFFFGAKSGNTVSYTNVSMVEVTE